MWCDTKEFKVDFAFGPSRLIVVIYLVRRPRNLQLFGKWEPTKKAISYFSFFVNSLGRIFSLSLNIINIHRFSSNTAYLLIPTIKTMQDGIVNTFCDNECKV